MADDEEVQVYCVCRTSDISRFMIMCDNCEEWYHGDCIRITEEESRSIKYFYCKPCRQKNPFLKIRYRKNKKKRKAKREKEMKKKRRVTKDREKDEFVFELKPPPSTKDVKQGGGDEWYPTAAKRKVSSESSRKKSRESHAKKTKTKYSTSTYEGKDKSADHRSYGCGHCLNCLREDDCGDCEYCIHAEKYGRSAVIGEMCRRKYCISQQPEWNRETKPQIDSHTTDRFDEEISYKNLPFTHKDINFTSIVARISKTETESFPSNSSRTKQCYGPQCTRAARKKSKYCSAECGRRLAAKRLALVMPSHVADWVNRPTVADEIGSAELERIALRMAQARSELQALEDKFQRLEVIAARSKTFPISEHSADDDDGDESDYNVFCVVCGHPVSLKSAIKHMDKCYIKIESQISFGSVFPTRIEGSERLFCDVYNPQQQTYCKRLQVLCPEHTKEPKIPANEVCGCPLTNDIYEGDMPTEAHEFCSRPKRKCNKHYKWESMYRASVDLQRIRQWLKIDEIFEEERRIRNAMMSRGGVIPLLLHQTIAHDPNVLDMRTKPTDVKKPAYKLVI